MLHTKAGILSKVTLDHCNPLTITEKQEMYKILVRQQSLGFQFNQHPWWCRTNFINKQTKNVALSFSSQQHNYHKQGPMNLNLLVQPGKLTQQFKFQRQHVEIHKGLVHPFNAHVANQGPGELCGAFVCSPHGPQCPGSSVHFLLQPSHRFQHDSSHCDQGPRKA